MRFQSDRRVAAVCTAAFARAAIVAAIALRSGTVVRADDDAEQARIEQLHRWAAAGTKHEDRIRSALRDESPWVRLEAALALWKVRTDSQEAVDVLLSEVRGADFEVAKAASEALASLGAAGVNALASEVTSGSTRAAAMYGLSSVDAPDPGKLDNVRDACVATLKQPGSGREVRYCLGLVGSSAALRRSCEPLALPYLKSEEFAGSVLTIIEKSAARESQFAPLRQFIGADTAQSMDGDSGVVAHRHAAGLLCRFGVRGVEAILDTYAREGEHPFAGQWVSALLDHSGIAFDPMLGALRSREARKRELAVWYFAKSELDPVQSRRLIPDLTRLMLEDEDAELRETITWKLPRMVKSAGCIERVAELENAAARHKDEKVRVAAIDCLAAAGHFPVDLLLEQLKDPSQTIRIAAIDALGAAGPRASKAVDPVLAALNDGAPAPYCVWTLARIAPNDARVVAVVVKRLEAEARTDAIWSARAAARMGSSAKSAEPLLRLLTGKGWDIGLWRWRQLALWRVAGKREDLTRLLRGLKVALPDYCQLPLRARDSLFDVLIELGDDARPLASAVADLSQDDSAVECERRRLAELARRLRVAETAGSEK